MTQSVLNKISDGGLKTQKTFMSQTRKFETHPKGRSTTGGINCDTGVCVCVVLNCSVKKKRMICVMIKVCFILHNQWQIYILNLNFLL